MQFVALFLMLLIPASVQAAETPSMGGAMLQMGWALLVVIGLILAIYGLTKKRFLLGKMGGNAIKIIELRPLMPKSSLALVEVRGQEYLLGISADRIQLIADLSQNPQDKDKPNFDSLLAEHQ
jgi:flagellar protein FliO/FliZ